MRFAIHGTTAFLIDLYILCVLILLVRLHNFDRFQQTCADLFHLKILTKTNEDLVPRQSNFIWDVAHAEQKTANQVVAKATVAVVRAVATD